MNCSQFSDLLDAYIDGEMDDVAREGFEKHAKECESCMNQLRAAEQLRDFLSQMDDDIAVPLPAQAAWRSAVRQEARRRTLKRIYSAAGAVAAACILTLGVTTMLHSSEPAGVSPAAGRSIDAQQVAFVETDGLSEDAVLDASAQPIMMKSIPTQEISYVNCCIATGDIESAHAYLMDIVVEYGALVEREVDADGEKSVYLQVAGENAREFAMAVSNIQSDAEETVEWAETEDAVVGICVVIAQE